MEFNHLLMRVHCRMLTNIFQDLSFCCPIIQTMVKIERLNPATSLLFSRYLCAQFPYFQGATYSEPQQILPGDVMSNCTNRDSSTFLSCFPSTKNPQLDSNQCLSPERVLNRQTIGMKMQFRFFIPHGKLLKHETISSQQFETPYSLCMMVIATSPCNVFRGLKRVL